MPSSAGSSVAGVSGIATEGDFVEVPSQLLEEFFRNAKLLAGFARHYETDEPIPAELVARMNRASAFGRGNGVRGQLFYTRFSLDLHNIDPATIDLDTSLHAGYTAACRYMGGWQPAVFELHAPRRLLVELLHLSIRQGDCARFLSSIRHRQSGGGTGSFALSKRSAGAGRLAAGRNTRPEFSASPAKPARL